MVEPLYKFPSTPHLAVLPGSRIRGDKVLSEEERARLLGNAVLVQEKIDGANLGVSFDSDGNVKLQNRGEYLREPYTGQWKEIERWLNPKIDVLFDGLSDRFVLFGEWCYAKHSIHYDHLPDWLLAFDIFEKVSQRFFSFRRAIPLFRKIDVQVVPHLKSGLVTLPDLWSLTVRSSFASGPAEGVYVRLDSEDWLEYRVKLVRPEFTQSIAEHWSRKVIVPNKLIAGKS